MNAVFAFHPRNEGKLAYISDGSPASARCSLFWLGGFKSSMTGEKATALATWAESTGRHLLRFDYSGHGGSEGDFLDGSISLWLDQAIDMFRTLAPGPRIILGSSMGAWLALLLLRRLKIDCPDDAARIRGLILLAPAIDMTEALISQAMTPEEHEQLARHGKAERPSDYDDGPYVITRKLLEDGRSHSLLGAPFQVCCPVRILHGDADPDVPWQHGMKTFEMLAGKDVNFALLKGRDHRLSDPRSLKLLVETAAELCSAADDVTAPPPEEP